MKPQPTHITKVGYKAGIYSTDNGGDYPVHAWMEYKDGTRCHVGLTADFRLTTRDTEPYLKPIPKKLERETICIWYKDGTSRLEKIEPTEFDLVNAIAVKKFTLIAEEGDGFYL